jgi:hypothetical protein
MATTSDELALRLKRNTTTPARRRLGVYGMAGLPWASLSREAFS